jgi:hypothetical protein
MPPCSESEITEYGFLNYDYNEIHLHFGQCHIARGV